ncbi:KdsC family phosphatase [Thermodesulfobacteriota bacterium]
MDITQKATQIKLLILDVDGVMTEGQILLDSHGEEIKVFNVKDGQGLRLLMRAGIDVAIISGRRSKALQFRAEELKISEAYQAVDDKGAICQELCRRKKLTQKQVCCMGDDLPDLPLFSQAGLSIAVADAAAEVLEAADFITEHRGGKGAVREACELILKAQKKWPTV